ncbi:MAG: hypothetical protein IK115_06245 [Lachnospiraceae bacterium]|nr:hypothetical protein [Lachnospiraceae bacterium]
MDVKCGYCDSFFDDTLEKCPNCGATNENIRRISDGIPKTIAELQQYCVDHKVPVQQMHFHIGEDYKGAKAYGIYREGEKVIVYKNKADGSRAVRYSGKDEAYAVNEIFQKMRTEYNGHKEANAGRQQMSPQKQAERAAYQQKLAQRRKENRKNRILGITILVLVGIFLIIAIANQKPGYGYYNYKNEYYYQRPNGSWYLYNNYDWEPVSAPLDDMSDYYSGSYWDSDYNIGNFADSSYYDPSDYSSSSSSSYDDDDNWRSSWDDDDDWDSGSSWDWDSGSDWDSDW